jgi:hypothetical protein
MKKEISATSRQFAATVAALEIPWVETVKVWLEEEEQKD